MITRSPISPRMVELAAKALWNQTREIEGRVEWDDAASWAREPYLQKARIVLETALPQEVDFLRNFAKECEKVADIL